MGKDVMRERVDNLIKYELISLIDSEHYREERMTRLLALFCLLTVMTTAWGLTVTIGTGTGVWAYPFNDLSTYSRSQSIYLASEVGISGNITSLSWFRSDSGADPDAIGATEIWLNTVSASSYTSTTWENEGILVATINNQDLGSGNAWYTVTLTEPYYYDASQGNFQVSVRTQNAPHTDPWAGWLCTVCSVDRCRAGQSSDTNPPTIYMSAFRSNIQINMTTDSPGLAINPTPASGVTLVSLSGNLNWTFGPYTSTYDLYLGPTGSETLVVSYATAGTTGSHAFSGLAYSTNYTWRVLTRTAAGVTCSGQPWTFTTRSSSPDVVTNPSPVDGAENLATNGTLSWTFGNLTSTYDLYLGPTGSEVMVVDNAAVGATGSYVFSGLSNNTAYSWHIVSRNTLSRAVTVGPTWTFTTEYSHISTFPYTDGFETSVPPAGWRQSVVSGTSTRLWSRVSTGSYPTTAPHSGSYMAYYYSFAYPSGTTTRMISRRIDFLSGGVSEPRVSLFMCHDAGFYVRPDAVRIEASPDGVTWTLIATIPRYGAAYTTPAWVQHTVNLGPTWGQDGVYISITGYSACGMNIYVDDLTIDDAATTHTVSGMATLNGSPLSGVTLQYVGTTTGSLVTAADGAYSFTVAANWSGTITPSLDGYTFAPISATMNNVVVNQRNVNFAAIPSLDTVYNGSFTRGLDSWQEIDFTGGAWHELLSENGNSYLHFHHEWAGDWNCIGQEIRSRMIPGEQYRISLRYRYLPYDPSPNVSILFGDTSLISHATQISDDMLPEDFIGDNCWHDISAVFTCTTDHPSESEPMLHIIFNYGSGGDLDLDDLALEFTPTSRLTCTPATGQAFGALYLGDMSFPHVVTLRSTGSDTLNVAGVSWSNNTGMFPVDPASWPAQIVPGDSLRFSVRFVPTRTATFTDTLVITTDAANQPAIRLPFSGTGQFAAPSVPQNMLIALSDNNAVITWNPVTTTIQGTPLTPDAYVVEYSENEAGAFYYLGFTPYTSTIFTHSNVLLYGNGGNPANHMFYRVKAVKQSRAGLVDRLINFHLTSRMTWEEVSKAVEEK
jgi:hypothetical protein